MLFHQAWQYLELKSYKESSSESVEDTGYL